MERLLTVKEAARYLGMSASTLNHWRQDGSGPSYVKMRDGRSAPVRYREADLRAYVEARMKGEAAHG
jgi:excisionase family DNA binding protein